MLIMIIICNGDYDNYDYDNDDMLDGKGRFIT